MNRQNSPFRRSQSSVSSPSEILAGFLAGLLLSVLPIAAVLSSLRNGAWPGLQASLRAAELPTMLLFWVAGGAITALLFTTGFALTAQLVINARQRSVRYYPGAMPVTGDEHSEEEEQD